LQAVEAAKEWLDTKLPPNFVQSYAARNCSTSRQAAKALAGEEPVDQAPAWWDNEEADAQVGVCTCACVHVCFCLGIRSFVNA